MDLHFIQSPEFPNWLARQEGETLAWLAERIALREAPILLSAIHSGQGYPRDPKFTPYLRCLITMCALRAYPGDAALQALCRRVGGAASAYLDGGNAFLSAVNVLNYHDEGDFNHDKAAFNTYEGSNTGGKWCMEDVLRDVMSVASHEVPAELPLWRAEPNKAAAEWATVSADWQSPDSPFRFWARWYQSALDGFPLPSAMQRDIALIDEADWQAGPARVAERIAEIELRYALAASENAERVEINPETGLLRLVPDSDLAPELGSYIRRKMAKARALFPASGSLAQQYVAIQPELDLLDDMRLDADNLPVEMFDACASVSRRVSQRGALGECPTADQDAILADFLSRIRDIGADIVANDAKTQAAITNRNAVLGNDALAEAHAPLKAFSIEIAKVSEGRLRSLPDLVVEATEVSVGNEDRKAASFKVASRVIRVVKVVAGVGLATAGVVLTVEGLANSPWANAAYQAALKYFGFG